MARSRQRLVRLGALVAVTLLSGACSLAGSEDQPLTTFDPAGPFAERIDNLFWPVFWIAAAVFILVQGAILVAVFSVFFLSNGLEAWFSERIRSSLDNSLAVAEAYLAEHKEIIRADALAMAADLNRIGNPLVETPEQLWDAWTSLAVAPELRVTYERGAETKEIVLPIAGPPAPELLASLTNPSPPPRKPGTKRGTIVIESRDPAGDAP